MTTPPDIATLEDIVQPEDIVQSENIVSQEDIVHPKDIVQPENIVSQEDTVSPEDIVHPKDTVHPEDTVQPEDIISPEDIVMWRAKPWRDVKWIERWHEDPTFGKKYYNIDSCGYYPDEDEVGYALHEEMFGICIKWSIIVPPLGSSEDAPEFYKFVSEEFGRYKQGKMHR